MRDGCWEWAGKLRKDRYARVEIGGVSKLVHRLAYEFAAGPIPDGMCVCHACDNPPCCNPAHLFLGTHLDNMRDMYSKGRRRSQKGAEHHRTHLTDDQVLEMRRAYVENGTTQTELAARFGVSQQQVSLIVRGKAWAHLGDLICQDRFLNTANHARHNSRVSAAMKPRQNGRFVRLHLVGPERDERGRFLTAEREAATA